MISPTSYPPNDSTPVSVFFQVRAPSARQSLLSIVQKLILFFFNVEPEIDIKLFNLRPNQGKDFSISYDVQSYPPSRIKWWRSKKESPYELIAECPPSGDCVKIFGKEIISKKSFEIKKLKFPDDEFFYKCNASNKYGNDSKEFQLEVYGNFLRLFLYEAVYIKEFFAPFTLS